MDPVGELSQIVDRAPQLGVDLFEARAEHVTLRRPEPSLQETKREHETDEPLLGAVMEVALEPPALGVTRFDDAGTRGAEIFELRAHLGLQTLVLEPEARRRYNFVDELRVVEEIRPVEQDGDRPAVAKKGRRSASFHAGEVDGASPRVRVAFLAHRIGDLKLRIGKRSRERLLKTARRSRLAELDDEPGDG
jgi:hypothetical protein